MPKGTALLDARIEVLRSNRVLRGSLCRRTSCVEIQVVRCKWTAALPVVTVMLMGDEGTLPLPKRP